MARSSIIRAGLCVVILGQGLLALFLSNFLSSDYTPAPPLYQTPPAPPMPPPIHHSPMPPSPPAPPLDPLELRSALLHLIDDLQHPPDCSTAPLYVYLPTAYTSGLGSQVRMIASSMLQAIVLRRTFVVDAAASVYVHPSRCPDRGYDCLFLPLSNCTLADAMIEIDGSSSQLRHNVIFR